MAAFDFRARASGVPILVSRLSTSVSTRDTKNDATDAIVAMSCPLAAACSSPSK